MACVTLTNNFSKSVFSTGSLLNNGPGFAVVLVNSIRPKVTQGRRLVANRLNKTADRTLMFHAAGIITTGFGQLIRITPFVTAVNAVLFGISAYRTGSLLFAAFVAACLLCYCPFSELMIDKFRFRGVLQTADCASVFYVSYTLSFRSGFGIVRAWFVDSLLFKVMVIGHWERLKLTVLTVVETYVFR